MKFKSAQTLGKIANLIGADFLGDSDFKITGINEIHVVEKGDLVFVDHPKYYDKALNSAATTILIDKEVSCPKGKALLISNDPFRDFNKITKYFSALNDSSDTGSKSATIGIGTVIHPNVFLGDEVTIGKNCTIYPNVTIYNHTIIGDNVVIHANTVLGADAFYYKKKDQQFDQLLSVGRVILNDNVHIGASCTIDKGVSSDTIIGQGTKIDNQVHVGHDSVIGENCLIASQTGLAGCVVIEDHVTIWGQVGITSGVVIGSRAVILGQTGVTKSVSGGKVYFGTPVAESREKLKELAYLKRLLKEEKKE